MKPSTGLSRAPIVLALFAAGVPLVAQTPRFSSGVDAVRVDALVTDGTRPVPGLAAENFELRDNGVLQQITDVTHETVPLSIICVLDVSGSVAGAPLGHLKDAMHAVIEALGPNDRAALVTFSHRLRIHTTLTGDRVRLGAQLEEVSAGGGTALLDATFAGLALRESDAARSLLLLFSDGFDTASWLPARRVLDAARRTEVVVYPVAVRLETRPVTLRGGKVERPPQIRSEPAEELLEAFADETGGRVVHADSERGLRQSFVAVLSEFRQRYVLSYTPSGVAGDGWHTLDVKLRGRKGHIKARRGYVARPVTRD